MKEPKKKNMTVLIQKYLYKKKHNQGDKSLLISRKMVYDDGQGWLIKTHHSLKNIYFTRLCFSLCSVSVY